MISGRYALEEGQYAFKFNRICDFRGKRYDMPDPPKEEGRYGNDVGTIAYYKMHFDNYEAKLYLDDIYNLQLRDLYYDSEYYKLTGFRYSDVASDKGMFGEYLIEQIAKGYEKDEGFYPFGYPEKYKRLSVPYYILYNVVVPEPNGLFQEIDCLIIVCGMVFVLESKNRNGIISIKDYDDENWTRKIKKEEYEIHSPLLQNDQHIAALEHYLSVDVGIKDVLFLNHVVFGMDVEEIAVEKNVTNYKQEPGKLTALAVG